MTEISYHEPVLLRETIEGLNITPNGVYVDATYGGGGHSAEIMKSLHNGKLIAFDQDEDALKNALNDSRFTLVNANFRFLKNFLQYYQVIPVDGIMADLGISSHQIDDPLRGFSTRFESDIDLRMDKRSEMDAKMVLNEYSFHDLRRIFFQFGEFHNANKIANAIINFRLEKKIETVQDLKEAVVFYAERGKENKFFAKIFQALRIEINDELEALKEFLFAASKVLKPGGKLVVISYHSLEDRIVKNFMKSGNFEGISEKDFFGNEISPFSMETRKPVVPCDEEILRNKRSRSAKMRIAIKK